MRRTERVRRARPRGAARGNRRRGDTAGWGAADPRLHRLDAPLASSTQAQEPEKHGARGPLDLVRFARTRCPVDRVWVPAVQEAPSPSYARVVVVIALLCVKGLPRDAKIELPGPFRNGTYTIDYKCTKIEM